MSPFCGNRKSSDVTNRTHKLATSMVAEMEEKSNVLSIEITEKGQISGTRIYI